MAANYSLGDDSTKIRPYNLFEYDNKIKAF